MDVGLFLMPAHPPRRSLADANRWNVDVLAHADRLGFAEAWIGEHHTVPWEPIPAPDLVIAQALQCTERIRLGPGAHIVPFWNPGVLATRLAYLDHASGGRLNVAFTQGTSITDWRSYRPDTEVEDMLPIMEEGVELILRYWTDPGPWRHEGRFFTAESVGPHPPENALLAQHIFPLQQPTPPIALAGITAESKSMTLCGARGWLPMSLNLPPRIIGRHWDRIREGAAGAGRPEPDRSTWRVVKEVFVAETDEEARRLAVEGGGGYGEYAREFNLPLFRDWDYLHLHKDDLDTPDSAIDVDYLADRWLIGSVDTVTRKLEELQDTLGGFGTLLVLGMDYGEHREAWFESMRLLAEEVAPRVPGAVLAG